MTELGPSLRQARVAAGLSLSGMALRTGYSRSYLGNVETGVRDATASIVKAYEKALGGDMNRRSVLVLGMASAMGTMGRPDVAVDVVRDIAAERDKFLSTVQTDHWTDRTIASLVAGDAPSVASLYRWMAKGNTVLRANAAGILAKLRSPTVDDDVIRSLRRDPEARGLYLTAAIARVLKIPRADAGAVAAGRADLTDDQITPFLRELSYTADSGARWFSTLMISRAPADVRATARPALNEALRAEPSREVLRSIGFVLAGLDPLEDA